MMRRAVDGALWVAAALGVVSLLAATAVAIFGLVPLVFTSGSMSPDIPAGSLGFARTVQADQIRVGDVVSVETAEGRRVTHRVVAAEPGPDGVVLQLKGDANGRPDRDAYTVTQADRLALSLPWLGYAVSWLSEPIAAFLGGVLAAAVVLALIVLGRGSGGSEGGRRTGRRRSRRAMAATAGVTSFAMLATVTAQPTMAAFTDQGGTVTTSGFIAHRVSQPASLTCSSNSLEITGTTPATDPRYTYWLRAFTAAGTPITAFKQMTGTGSTRSATFNGTTDFTIGLEVGVTYYLRVYARVGSTTWESVDYRSHPFSKAATLVNCGAAPIAPTIGFTRPTNGMSRTTGTLSGSMHAEVTGVCEDGTYGTSSALACGTVTDNGSVTNVQYLLQRNAGSGGVRCWNDTALTGFKWSTNCSFRNAVTSTGKWAVFRGFVEFPYAFSGTFTLTIRATDNEGNVSEASINYTVT